MLETSPVTDEISTKTLVLNSEVTARSLTGLGVLGAVEKALVAVSTGKVSAPPRIAAFSDTGLLSVMPGFVPGLGMAAKVVSVFPTAGSPGRSLHRGIVILFDETDGRPMCLMDGEILTARRTAATATLALQTLASHLDGPIAVIGTGVQAEAQLEWLQSTNEDRPIVIAGRNPARAGELAEKFGASVESIEQAARTCSILLCATGADRPVLEHSWLRDDVYISSVGGSHGPEVDAETVRDSTIYTEWYGAVTSAFPAGAHELQGLESTDVTLLGDVLTGQAQAVNSGLILYKSTGHASLDVAASRVAYEQAVADGLGSLISL